MSAVLHDLDYYIHHGSTACANPYEFDATPEQIESEQDKINHVVDELKLNKSLLPSDFLDDIWEMGDMMIRILYDDEDDKEGRLHDLVDDKFTRFAEWLVRSGNTSSTIKLKQKLGI